MVDPKKSMLEQAVEELVIGGRGIVEKKRDWRAAKAPLDELAGEQGAVAKARRHLQAMYAFMDDYIAYYAQNPDRTPWAHPEHPDSFLTRCSIREFNEAGEALGRAAQSPRFARQKEALQRKMAAFDALYLSGSSGEAPKWPRSQRDYGALQHAIQGLLSRAQAIEEEFGAARTSLHPAYSDARNRFYGQVAVSAAFTGLLAYGVGRLASGMGRALKGPKRFS